MYLFFKIAKNIYTKQRMGGFLMNRAISAIMGGAAAAAAVGTAVYMMNNRHSHSNVRRMRKNAAKTVKAVGSIANGISSIMH